MTRLLLVCEFATLNGGEHSMLATVDLVRSAGFELIVAAPVQGPLAEALALYGIDVFPIDFADAQGARKPMPALRENLSGIIHRVQPALVHANSLSMSRLLGPVSATMKVPGLGHLRDIVKLSRQAIDDVIRLDRRLAVSEAVRSSHVAQGMNGESTVVCYNGVDLQRFRPHARTGWLNRELRLTDSAALLGTVGQIALRKGHDLMGRALQRVIEQATEHGMDVHWLIVGERYSDKPESQQFEASLCALASSGPLAGRIHFMGYQRDMPAIYSELTMLVHPARQEPLGRVLLEAGACGLPIVATDVGGTAEIYPRALNAARLVSPGNEALADTIIEILREPQLGTKMGQSARTRIEQAFDRRAAAERLVQHYREVLSS